MAFDKLKDDSPGSIDLLRLCAFLAPEDIPLSVIRNGAEYLPEPLRTAAGDDTEFDSIIAALMGYSLVERKGESLSVHRLLRAVVMDGLSVKEKKRWAEAAVKIVNDAFPRDAHEFEMREICEPLLPHALSSANYAQELDVGAEAAGRLFNGAGLYLKQKAQYIEAKS